MTEYQFTKDWFQWAPEVWTQLIPMLPERAEEGRCFLEIGSFEGRSTVWIMENMMQDGDEIHCVDTWEGGEEHSEEDMDSVYGRFTHNMQLLQAKQALGLSVCMGTSTQELAHWLIEEPDQYPHFDFIYIDGSHQAHQVLRDAVNADAHLRAGGILAFDDYRWGSHLRDTPAPAIDAFLRCFEGRYELLDLGLQVWVRKQ